MLSVYFVTEPSLEGALIPVQPVAGNLYQEILMPRVFVMETAESSVDLVTRHVNHVRRGHKKVDPGLRRDDKKGRDNKQRVNDKQRRDDKRVLSFRVLDQIISNSALAYPLNRRIRKGDISFQLRQICRWKNSYLVKFSIQNDAAQDFFISDLKAQSGKKKWGLEIFVPISCRPGEIIYGIAIVDQASVQPPDLKMVLRGEGAKQFSYEVRLNEAKYL